MADKVTSSLAEAKVLVMQGMKGDTGYSPTVSVQDITEPIPGGTKVIGHTVTITDATGAHSFNVMNGEDGEGGGGSYNPDEELAQSFQLTVSGTTVTLNDTAVNVSAAIQSARPVLFYTVSGGSFTFFGVSGMDYETGEIRLTTLFDGSGQTVTLAPSGSTMTGTMENVSGGSELPAVSASDNGKSLVVVNGAWAASGALQTKSITDTGNYYTTDTVDGALQEIGAELAGINTLIGSGVIT